MGLLDVDKLKEQGKRFSDGFTTGQKTVTIGAVVFVFLAMFMFTKWAGKPDYAPLFTDLDSKSAGEVTQALDSAGVSYKLTDGGSTVEVPRANLYKTRADLSTKGVPEASSDGWSIMDQGGITKSEFANRVDYQRALQTELAKTISAIDGVGGATVNLTIPQQSVFAESDEDQSSAAVLVTPTTGTSMTSEKVQAIVNLVSSSVPSLKPENVTVADSLGNVLSAPGQDGNTSFKNQQQLQQTNVFESDLAKKLEALIAASLGPNHAAVTVSADLDFNEQTSKSTTNKKPGGKDTPTKQSVDTETCTGCGNTTQAGVLGPSGTPLNQTGTSTPPNYNHQVTQSEFAIDQVQTEIKKAPGTINSLSVAALIDKDKVKQADLTSWTDSLTAAAGISKTRGDKLNINLVPFDTTAAKAAEAQVKDAASAKSQDFLLNLLRSLVTLLIVGTVLFLAWRSIKRSGAVSGPVRVPLDLRELQAGDLVGGRLDTTYERAAQELGGTSRTPAIEPAHVRAEQELAGLIEHQPDEVAQTLRSWLADRRT
jgi:flagellar M-ring protein FliF